MKALILTLKTSLGALLASAFLSAPAFAGVTILDFGSLTANGGANTPYTEVIEAGDPTPTAFNGVAPDMANPVGVGPIALTDGATIEWSDVTTWNNNLGGNAGDNYFAHQVVQDAAIPTTFSIVAANPGDMILVEAVAGATRDGDVRYGSTLGAANIVPTYVPGTSEWTLVGSSIGSSTGLLDIGTVADEGNVGAFRVTITPVPEPGTFALFGLAGLALMLRRRR